MWNYKFLIASFLALMALIFGNQYLSEDRELSTVIWTLSSSEKLDLNEQIWQVGSHPVIGFSDKYLHFQLPLSGVTKSVNHLTVSPTFLDKVVVTFIDSDGAVIGETIKGDKYGDPALSYVRDFSQFVFNVPVQAVSAQVVVSSTSNLNATVTLHAEDELFFNILTPLIIVVSFCIFLLVAVAIDGFIWWSVQSNVSIWFAAYLVTWMAVTVASSNVLVMIDTRYLGLNDALFSWGAIWAGTASKLYLYSILRMLMKPNFLLRIIMLSIVLGPISFLIYALFDERIAFSLNVLSLGLTFVFMAAVVPFVQGKDHTSTFVLKKIRVPLVLLLLTGISGAVFALGYGSTATMRYLPLTASVLFNLYFIFILFIMYRRKNANNLLKSRSLVAINGQLSKQYEEQVTLFAMLFHEIKTPLTSLKFILYRWAKKPEADAQIDHISHVLEQIEVMHKLEQVHSSAEQVSVIDVVHDNWRQQPGLATLSLQTKGNCQVMSDPFLIQTIIKNVLSNAVKHSSDGHVKVLVYRLEKTCYLRVQNTVSVNLDYDFSKVTEKYWRAEGKSVARGTGLGLWLVKQLCGQASIVLDIALRHGRFSVTLEIPCTPL